MTETPEEKRQREAEQALRRVEMESESIGTSSFARTANKTLDHFKATDADQQDSAEIWGTRIARFGSVIVAIVLIVWLINHFNR